MYIYTNIEKKKLLKKGFSPSPSLSRPRIVATKRAAAASYRIALKRFADKITP